MKDKSLEMLEFPRVREILAGYTSFAASHELALAVRPLNDAESILKLLARSAEARHLLSIDLDFSIGGILDIRNVVIEAARGKTLELQSLVDIQRTLSAIRSLHNKLSRMADEAPLLASINSRIEPLPQLEKEINRCISPAAELLDNASERLSELRRLIKDKRSQIVHRLDAILKSQETGKYIQEQLITERDGRYVIPLKVEMRRELKGIVHDISNTGATAFVEPLVTIDMGNELREMVIAEQHEVERILGMLSAAVGDEEAVILMNLKLAAEIDLDLAKARFAHRFHAVEPLLSGLQREEEYPGPKHRVIRLVNARHPLLQGKPVPMTIEMGQDFKGLVITGPNTGGKTVALKTIGLLALMAQAGLPIPAAHESSLPVFDNIFADIGDEQSIEQTLSTFSWHMGNIVRILKDSTSNSLVLLDELGTATDPGEGSALAQSILLHFVNQGTLVIATTHFSELKAFAHSTPGLRNASLDLDPITLAPTYHLTVGLPGGSNALSIAAQLGIPHDIIENARRRLSQSSLEIEALLADLNASRQKLEETQNSIQSDKEAAEKLRLKLEDELRALKETEQNILYEVRSRLVREGDELQREIRDALYGLKKTRSQEKVEQAQKALNALREQLKGRNWKPVQSGPENQAETAFKAGQKVWLPEMNVQGVVVSAPDSNGQLEVQVGSTKIRMSPENLEKAKAAPPLPQYASSGSSLPSRVAALELDLRGRRADEVEYELDAYLNDASLAHLLQVRIIHGVATGTVRQIVRAFLVKHPLVQSFRAGKKEEGGDGVTVVTL
ncbi:MAG TPA: endonuclease MutS2 [Dehalococcoidales bacterium]|nr:endonuclease MutS2 [Dehalococcoidales bacterium]